VSWLAFAVVTLLGIAAMLDLERATVERRRWYAIIVLCAIAALVVLGVRA
jgi:hypothetical protein